MSVNSNSLEPLIAKLFRRSYRNPDSTIFIFDGEKYALGVIANEVISVAVYLESLDIRDNFIVLSLPNSASFAVAFLAGNMCNLNVGVFNDLWPDAIIEKTLEALGPGCVFFDTRVPDTACLSIDVRSIVQREYETGFFLRLADKLKVEHDLERPFYTGFTSGSSGIPKGFVRNGASWVLSFEADKREFAFSENDVFICPGSFAHSLFLYALLRALYSGILIVAYSRFRPERIIQDIHTMSATVLFVVPTQLLVICQLAASKQVRFSSARLVLSAGAKLNDRVRALAEEIFPNAEIAEFYGSSEHGYISVARQSENPPAGSVGRAFDGVDIAIKNLNGQDARVGKVGQIYVKSPYVFEGYAKTGECPDAALANVNGYIGTGDTGYLDEKGFLFLSGRTDRMIVSSGRNIHPETVEAVLLSIKGIEHAAVLSQACEHRGQKLFAVLQFQGGKRLARRELIEAAKKALPPYAVPKVYFECNDWPLTVSYKTDYQRLKAMASAGLVEITL